MVFGVAVDGSGAAVEPDLGALFWGELSDGLADESGGGDAAGENGGFVFLGVAAVDAASGEVDDGVGLCEAVFPWPECLAIPSDKTYPFS